MTARCSLDDFISNNKYEVRVSPFCRTVTFPGSSYRVPSGMLFDLLALEGKGFQLEAPSLREGVDISKSVGLAFILNSKGKRTGYHLSSRGGQNIDGKYFGYFLEDDIMIFGSQHQRFRRATDPKRTELYRKLQLPYV